MAALINITWMKPQGVVALGNVLKLRHHLIFSRKERKRQSRKEDICALFPYAFWREISLT